MLHENLKTDIVRQDGRATFLQQQQKINCVEREAEAEYTFEPWNGRLYFAAVLKKVPHEVINKQANKG